MAKILSAFHYCGLLTGCLFLVYCGSDDHLSQNRSSVDTDSVLLVAMGGNTSCGSDSRGRPTPYRMNMYPHFKALVDDVRNLGREAVRYVASCYTAESTVYYASSDDPETIYEESADDFYATIDGLALRDRSRVFMAGHSYGGWLTMKTVLNTTVDFEGVFTLDPISRVTCTFALPLGCTMAPGDIGNGDRQLIADRSTFWQNFYQTRTFYLHSSAMSQADVNTDMRVGHNSVHIDRRVWQAIADRINPVAIASN